MNQQNPRPVWQKKNRRKRRKKRNKSRQNSHSSRTSQMLTAYIARAAALLILAIMLLLMVCGCLYIRDLFRKTKDTAHNTGSALESLSYANQIPLKGYARHTVILDAGHGGNDSGTIEQSASEKEINLSVVLKMKQLLENRGIQVILTRERDVFMELEERTEAAKACKADLFLSIHCNYYEDDSSIHGLECYYSQDSDEGKYYAEKIMDSIEKSGKIPSRNAKPADYYVLKNTDLPAVLVEAGYLSNYMERTNLISEEYQEILAAELVEGIIKGLNI